MPDTDTESPFYRPQSRVGCPRHVNDATRALREIYSLISIGPPKTLCEARRRLAAVNLIAQEGIGAETVFEMVTRLLSRSMGSINAL